MDDILGQMRPDQEHRPFTEFVEYTSLTMEVIKDNNTIFDSATHVPLTTAILLPTPDRTSHPSPECPRWHERSSAELRCLTPEHATKIKSKPTHTTDHVRDPPFTMEPESSVCLGEPRTSSVLSPEPTTRST